MNAHHPVEAYDLVVFGATPGGIVCAVRAAREGLSVLLVHHHAHIGGMMANGLGVFDTLYAGWRSPLYQEVHHLLLDRYASEFGNDSSQCREANWGPGPSANHRPKFEPHVAEAVFEDMLGDEPLITVLKEFYPVRCERNNRILHTVVFEHMETDRTVVASASAFVDAGYEGDLLHAAGCDYVVGRESRSTYGEPHAGKIFTRMIFASKDEVGYPAAAAQGLLNLRAFRATTAEILAGSNGEGDLAVQAYNFRVCLTNQPNNRYPVKKPSGYDRERCLKLRDRWGIGGSGPNEKCSWNAPLLIAGSHRYPEAGWPERRTIAQHHKDLALGLLWFLQNDEAVPEGLRTKAREWSLPRDEFNDNEGFPWEMYVREARRLLGRYVFTEQDGTQAPGIERTPIHGDSIGITEWPMDSHTCTEEEVPGCPHEGKVLLSELTRPGQIPYRCMLPADLDNLLVPVCLSSSHIGWGTLRLEPVWMQTGEAAAYAASMARRAGTTPGCLPPDHLVRRLVEEGFSVSFFNDFDPQSPGKWAPAIQYFGTKGFFPSYHAFPEQMLDGATARIWANAAAMIAGKKNPMETARRVPMPIFQTEIITQDEFSRMVSDAWSVWHPGDTPMKARLSGNGQPLTRGAACDFLYSLLKSG